MSRFFYRDGVWIDDLDGSEINAFDDKFWEQHDHKEIDEDSFWLEIEAEVEAREADSEEDWDEVDKAADEAMMSGMGFGVSSSSRGTVRSPSKLKKAEPRPRHVPESVAGPVEEEPVLDKDGEILTSEDIIEALKGLYEREIQIDADAKRKHPDHPEHQALRAKKLADRYKGQRGNLMGDLKKAQRYERYQRELTGIRDYGLSEDANRALTGTVDDLVEGFFDNLDRMKDAVAAGIRAQLDELGEEGIDTKLREKIYDEVSRRGIIENWEPLEF